MIDLEVILGEKVISSTPLMGGMMNQSSLVVTKSKKYVLYIPTAQANEMVDRAIEKEDQATCYSLGITSKNIYFDVEKGIKINEYIDGCSLDKTDSFDVKKVSKVIKSFHSSKKLSKCNYNPFPRLVAYEKEASEFCNIHNDKYDEMRKTLDANRAYLESQKMVFSHNDFQKSNIIASKDSNYYVIDFEFTGNNDPIYDIACFGNGLVKEGYELLKEYYKDSLSDDEIKRYYLWRTFISLQWRTVALIKHYRGEGKAHGFNFLDVADFFFANAVEAYDSLTK